MNSPTNLTRISFPEPGKASIEAASNNGRFVISVDIPKRVTRPMPKETVGKLLQWAAHKLDSIQQDAQQFLNETTETTQQPVDGMEFE
jgi:hypothetical protein